MVEEVYVTKAIAAWLMHANWKIERIALPRGGGLELLPNGAKPRKGERGVVPDIVARHQVAGVLLVESKPQPNLDDAAKLVALKSGAYDDSINFFLRVQAKDLLLGVGFGLPVVDLRIQSRVQERIPLGFGVSKSGAVTVEWNRYEDLTRTERF